MVPLREILEHDTVEMKDGRSLAALGDADLHRETVLVETGEGLKSVVRYQDIDRVADRAWVDHVLMACDLSPRHESVIRLFEEIDGPLHPPIVRAFLGITMSEARDDLNALVARGLAFSMAGFTSKFHRVDYWFPTKLCIAMAHRLRP